ncbi:MAG: RibD family protein [Spirochaetales bacterium]|nr:RibD family protein [Spirochaetales bacterium]
MKTPLPYVTVSYAQSLDGRIATKSGDSRGLGSPESLVLAHQLRRDHQAILVGIGTVLTDDPQLTCRLVQGRNPIRVILDTELRLPLESKLATTVSQAPVWLLYRGNGARKGELEAAGCRCLKVNDYPGAGKGLPAVLGTLANQGVSSVFVEGGAQVITSFLGSGLVDRLITVTVPVVLGKGIEAVGDLGVVNLTQALRPLSWKRWELGPDQVTELRFTPRQAPEEILGGS